MPTICLRWTTRQWQGWKFGKYCKHWIMFSFTFMFPGPNLMLGTGKAFNKYG